MSGTGDPGFDDKGEMAMVTPCFTTGTLIHLDRGQVAVERIMPGEMALTRDNGWQMIRWVGRRKIAASDLKRMPSFAPVQIGAGALGDDLPERDMMVSPQHRMLLTGPRALALFGENEVLAAAADLVGQPGIEKANPAGICYYHLLFDRHEIIRANGCWSESFQPGDLTLAGMDDAQRNELLALFPDLQSSALHYLAARRVLKREEARIFMRAPLH